MVGKKRRLGARKYKTYNEETLQRAVMLVKSGQLTERQAAEKFSISKSTIHRKRHDQNLLPVGRPCVLSNGEEEELGQLCNTCNKFIVEDSVHVCHTLQTTKMIEVPLPVTGEGSTNKPEENVHKDDIAELIEIIETSKPLWNYKLSITERSEAIKRNLWNHIFTHFNGKYTITGIQKTWKYLEEKYTREKKIAPSGSAGNKKEWPHLHNLKFLDEVLLNPKRTTESFETEADELEVETPKSKKKSSITDNMSEFLDKLKNSRLTSPLPIPIHQPDDDDKFGSYLASLMRDLPKRHKTLLQGKIIAMVINELNE